MALRCALIYIFFFGGGGVMVIRAWMLAVDSMCYNDRIWLMDRAHTNTKSSMQ